MNQLYFSKPYTTAVQWSRRGGSPQCQLVVGGVVVEPIWEIAQCTVPEHERYGGSSESGVEWRHCGDGKEGSTGTIRSAVVTVSYGVYTFEWKDVKGQRMGCLHRACKAAFKTSFLKTSRPRVGAESA